jgi:hypothetical protein
VQKADALFTSDRTFEVWRLAAGHSGLLLRCNPSADDPDRVEIWFKPAYAVCLPTLLRGVEIRLGEDDREVGAREVLGRALAKDEHLYIVAGADYCGWVVGGTCAGRADQRSYDAPTMFDGWSPADGVRELFLKQG